MSQSNLRCPICIPNFNNIDIRGPIQKKSHNITLQSKKVYRKTDLKIKEISTL